MSISHIAQVLPSVLPSQEDFTTDSLDALAKRFEAEESQEHPDVVVPMNGLRFLNDGSLAVPGRDGSFALNEWSKRQLASLVGVRWGVWFARMDATDQAAEINKRLWSSSRSLKVRTTQVAPKSNGVAGTVRALVSPTFSPLPDSQLLELLRTALEPVETELRVVRAHVTEQSASYVVAVGKAFRPGDDHEVGDLWGGITIRNSGVGFAAAVIVASFTRLLCKNGMTAPVPDAVLLHRAHRAFDLEKVRTRLIERLKGLPGKLADAARALVASRRSRIDDPRPAFLEILRAAHVSRKFLPELERAYEAEPALKGSAFGVSQAVTRAAQSRSPEERFDLETAAGEHISNLFRSN